MPVDEEISSKEEVSDLSTQLAREFVETGRDRSEPRVSRRRNALFAYLCQLDAWKALNAARAVGDREAVLAAALELGRADGRRALRAFQGIQDAKARAQCEEALLHGLAESDAETVFELVKDNPDSVSRLARTIFENWALHSPEGATNAAMTIESPASRRLALRTACTVWGQQAPGTLLDWIDAASLSAPEKAELTQVGLTALAKTDPDAAIERLEGTSALLRNRLLPTVLSTAAGTNPAAAVAWLRSEPEGYAKARAIKTVAPVLAESDPGAVIELSREFPAVRKHGLRNAFAKLASVEIGDAIAQLASWENDPDYPSLVLSVAQVYAARQLPEALSWASTLSGEARAAAIGSVLGAVASQNPASAVDVLGGLALDPASAEHAAAVDQIVTPWVIHDPGAASAWIDTLPLGWSRDRASMQVADQWIRHDPVGAAQWILELPVGEIRDQATGRLVRGIERDDPERAAAWAGSLSDQSLREVYLQRVLLAWAETDLAAARQALAASTLPPEIKQLLLARRPDREPRIPPQPAH